MVDEKTDDKEAEELKTIYSHYLDKRKKNYEKYSIQGWRYIRWYNRSREYFSGTNKINLLIF